MTIVVDTVSDSSKARQDLNLIQRAIKGIASQAARANDTFDSFASSRDPQKRIKEIESKISKVEATASGAAAAVQRIAISNKAANSVNQLNTTLTSTKQKAEAVNSSLAKTKVPTDVDGDLSRMGKSLTSIQGTVGNITTGIVSMTAAIAAFGTLRAFAQFSDAATNMSTKISISTNSANELKSAIEDIQAIAVSTRVPLATIGDLYSKIARGSVALNASQRQVAAVTQTVARSVALSGGASGEAAAAVMQLGQALGSGVLQGDELKSITENAQDLAQTLADGLHVSVGMMRDMGAAGLISTKAVFGALLNQSDAVAKRYTKVQVTFGQAFTNMGNSFLILFDKISSSGVALDLADKINGIAISVYNLAKNWDDVILRMRLHLVQFLSSIESLVPRIDFKRIIIKVGDIFPDLTTTSDFVWAWVKKVERAFAWLYDEIIGHSWIPDLVLGIAKWGRYLMGIPLALFVAFAVSVSGQFGNMAEYVGGLWGKVLAKFGNTSALDVAGKKISDIFDGLGGKTLMDKLRGTTFMKDVRQAFGLKETVGGTYTLHNLRDTVTRPYDTKDGAYVGRGPLKALKNRMPGHDFVNAFDSSTQRGIILAMSGALTLATIAAFRSGPVAGVITSVLTTGIALAMSNAFDSKVIAEAFEPAASSVRGLFNWVAHILFPVFDPLAYIGVIAKLMLAFAAGRAMLKDYAVRAIRSGTTLAGSIVENSRVRAAQSRLGMDTGLLARTNARTPNLTNVLQGLETIARARGAAVGPNAYAQALQRRSQGQMPQYNLSTQAGRDFAMSMERMIRQQNTLAANTARANALTRSVEVLGRSAQELEAQQNTRRAAFRNNFVGGATAIGGVVGAVGSLAIGEKIAESMVGYSEWSKVGAQMLAFVGFQTLGGVIGGMLGRAALAVLMGGIAVITSPITLAIATGAALIAAVANWEKVGPIVRELFQSTSNFFASLIEPAVVLLRDMLGLDPAVTFGSAIEELTTKLIVALRGVDWVGYGGLIAKGIKDGVVGIIAAFDSQFGAEFIASKKRTNDATMEYLAIVPNRIKASMDKAQQENEARRVATLAVNSNPPSVSSLQARAVELSASGGTSAAMEALLGKKEQAPSAPEPVDTRGILSRLWDSLDLVSKVKSSMAHAEAENEARRKLAEAATRNATMLSQDGSRARANALQSVNMSIQTVPNSREIASALQAVNLGSPVNSTNTTVETIKATNEAVLAAAQAIVATNASFSSKMAELGSLAPENKRLEAFGNLISQVEGTAKFGARTQFGNTQLAGLDQFPNRQGEFVNKSFNRAKPDWVNRDTVDTGTFQRALSTGNTTSAAGKFQFERRIWDDLAARLKLPDFSEESQNRAFEQYLKDWNVYTEVMSGRWDIAVDKLHNAQKTAFEGLPINGAGAKATAALRAAAGAVSGAATGVASTVTGAASTAGSKAKDTGNQLLQYLSEKAAAAKEFVSGLGKGPSGPLKSPDLSERLKAMTSQTETFEEINKELIKFDKNPLSDAEIKAIDPATVTKLVEMLTSLAELNKATGWLSSEVSKGGKEDTSKNIDKLREAIKAPDVKDTPWLTVGDDSKALGTAFAKKVSDSFAKGFEEVLKGKLKIGDFIANIWNEYSQEALSVMVKSFTDTVFKSLFASLGDQVAQSDAIGKKLGSMLLNALGIKEIAPGGAKVDQPGQTEKSTSIFSKIIDLFTGGSTEQVATDGNGLPAGAMGALAGRDSASPIIAAIKDDGLASRVNAIEIGTETVGATSNLGTSITSVIGALSAGGGSVAKGLEKIVSGVSDGIGDFFKNLLPFADGGVIPGPVGAPMPVMAHSGEVILNAAQQGGILSGLNDGGTQIFNVNITGDVSRQTRANIIQMLPMIASGVNAHNMERGLR